jgi:hypothetical protein
LTETLEVGLVDDVLLELSGFLLLLLAPGSFLASSVLLLLVVVLLGKAGFDEEVEN